MKPRTLTAWKRDISRLLKIAPDGFARLDVAEGEQKSGDFMAAIKHFRKAGHDCRLFYDIQETLAPGWLPGIEMPPGGLPGKMPKVFRLCISPRGFRPPTPEQIYEFATASEAQAAIIAAKVKHPGAYFSKPLRPLRGDKTSGARFIVKRWNAEAYLQANYPALNLSDLIAALQSVNRNLREITLVELSRSKGRAKGTEETKTKSKNTREKIRNEFKKLRAARPKTSSSMLREFLCGNQPIGQKPNGEGKYLFGGKGRHPKGFSRANVYKQTADLK